MQGTLDFFCGQILYGKRSYRETTKVTKIQIKSKDMEGNSMIQFKVAFTVNGKRTEQIVSATGPTEAKRLVQAQYAGSKVVIINTKDLKTGFYG